MAAKSASRSSWLATVSSDVSQRVERQVQQGALLEAAGVDPIADARRPEAAVAQSGGQAGRVGRGGLDRRALHDHDDVLELAEVLRVSLVERGVPLVEREQMELGRLERQGMRRVADAERGKGDAHGDRQRRAGAAEAHHALQEPARQRQRYSAAARRAGMAVTAPTLLRKRPSRAPENSAWRDLSAVTRASYEAVRTILLN